MLEVRSLTKRYHARAVVENVSFTALPGQVTGYLGPNGSGKSTTVKMITGLLRPTEGSVLFRGEDIARNLVAYKALVGYVPEEPHLYSYLSGVEYLEMVGQLRSMSEQKVRGRMERLLRLLSLWGDREAPLASYSKGMRQKVLIAAALMHNPELIVLDEPFSGLDITSGLILRKLIQTLAESGKVVLFSSHALEVVEKVSSRVVILHRGRVVANDSVAHLRNLMELPSLEDIFSQLAVEQDSDGIAREIVAAIEA
jgi:ABC-2 type transport system ATP-binding protein